MTARRRRLSTGPLARARRRLVAAGEEFLEALGVLDPYRRPLDVEELEARCAALEDRCSRLEARLDEFDRNWPEEYRHRVAAAAFDRIEERVRT